GCTAAASSYRAGGHATGGIPRTPSAGMGPSQQAPAALRIPGFWIACFVEQLRCVRHAWALWLLSWRTHSGEACPAQSRNVVPTSPAGAALPSQRNAAMDGGADQWTGSTGHSTCLTSFLPMSSLIQDEEHHMPAGTESAQVVLMIVAALLVAAF